MTHNRIGTRREDAKGTDDGCIGNGSGRLPCPQRGEIPDTITSMTFLLKSGCIQIPFRETHHISGRAVALAESRGVQLNELSFEDYRKLSDKFEQDVFDVYSFEASVERRNAIGGTSLEMIERQINVLRDILKN